MKKVFSQLQRLGKFLMLPIAVLPAAALLLRLGAEDVFNIPFIMTAGSSEMSVMPESQQQKRIHLNPVQLLKTNTGLI